MIKREGAALVDLDRTLLKGNSLRLFLTYLMRKGALPLRYYCLGLLLYLLYFFRCIKLETLQSGFWRFFRSSAPLKSSFDLSQELLAFSSYVARTPSFWNSYVLNKCKKLSRSGYDCFLLTSAPDLLVMPLLEALASEEKLNIRIAVCTRFYCAMQGSRGNRVASVSQSPRREIFTSLSRAGSYQKSLFAKRVRPRYRSLVGFGDREEDGGFLSYCDLLYLIEPSSKLKQLAKAGISERVCYLVRGSKEKKL